MRLRLLFPLVCSALALRVAPSPGGGAAASSPTLFWASSPTSMNETAVLLGDGLDSATSLTLCIAGTTTCTQVANADVRASSAKVTLPSTLALDVFTLSAANSTVQLNAPCVWWRQADVATHTASAGGWARVFGSSLAFANGACVPTSNPACGGGAACGARARLVPVAGGAAIDVPVTRASCFALDVAVPPGTPLGDYLLQVVNGLGASPWADTAGGNGGGTGGGGCSVARGGGNATTTTPLTVVAPAPWPSTVYNVVALGSVWAALDAARAAGGGVVYFPRGRYAFDENHTMNSVPPRTTLQGESADTVELYWRDMREPPRAHGAPTALIQGEAGFFAVKNVSLYAQGQYPDVISDGGFDGLIVAGVIIRADPYFMLLEPVNQSFHGRSMPIGSGANSGVSVSVSGSNWRVEDCDIVGGSHAVSMFVSDSKSPTWFARSRNGVLARNTLDGGFGVYRCEGVDGLIVEDNVMRGGGLNSLGSWISTYYAKSTSGVYMARNTMSRIMGGDRELLSFDGGGGAYGGAIAAVSPDGRTLTLATDPTFAGYIPPGPRLYNYTEAAVLIMKGRGEGQVRRVISNDWTPGGTNRSWVLDMPYDVAPDATSFVSIVPFRGDIIIAGNDFVDGGAIQLYAMAVNTIVAENTATRTSGFLSWGLNPHGAFGKGKGSGGAHLLRSCPVPFHPQAGASNLIS